MGWNEARITIVPDRWRLVLNETSTPSASGETVVLVSAERSQDSAAPMLCPDQFERWLSELGFVLHERWKSGASYERDDVLIDLYCENNEVNNISVQFTLTQDCPRHWAAWREFIQNLCDQWPVALGDTEQRMKVGPEHLFSVLSRTSAWQDFEKQFSWPNPDGGEPPVQ